MILAALILQAAVPQTAVEAERAFAAAAQVEGQWTAARRFAAPGAEVLTPRAVPVAEAYGDADPATAYRWWVSESYISCDGRTAVNTGPWERDGTHGWFTTVWQRQDDGSWKWILDSGDRLAKPRPRPADARVRQAKCEGKDKPFLSLTMSRTALDYANAEAKDHSLAWAWIVENDRSSSLSVSFWNGTKYEDVIDDRSPPAK